MGMTTLLTTVDSMGCYCPEPSIAEMLSESIVQAMMQADGVDPERLETMLRSVARNLDHV
jgi:hypothetical protein